MSRKNRVVATPADELEISEVAPTIAEVETEAARPVDETRTETNGSMFAEEKIAVTSTDVVDDAIKAEVTKRQKKERKPRSDAGRPRKRVSRDNGETGPESYGVALSQDEIVAISESVANMGVVALAGLAQAYSESVKDDKWKFTESDRQNFATAIKFITRKHANTIADNPEVYLLGVAVLGYVGTRFVIPVQPNDFGQNLSESLANPYAQN